MPSSAAARSMMVRSSLGIAAWIVSALGSGCGRTTSHGDGTAGTTDSDDEAIGGNPAAGGGFSGRGGNTAAGGGFSGAGGVSGSGGVMGRAGTASTGVAGAPLVEPESCMVTPVTRSCSMACGVQSAFSVRCPKGLFALQAASTNLLVTYAQGGARLGFREKAISVEESWQGTTRRWLASGASGEPIVVRIEDGRVVLSPQPAGEWPEDLDITAESLMDVGFDAGALRVLGRDAEKGVLWSVTEDGTIESKEIAELRAPAFIIPGSSPPWILSNGSLSRPFDDGAGANDASSVAGSTATAVAFNGELVFAEALYNRNGEPNGTVTVSGAVPELTLGGERALQCPEPYTAYDPDICKPNNDTGKSTGRAILAHRLLVNLGEHWLIAVTGEVEDRCQVFGACIETLPCDCEYRRFGRIANPALEITSLTRPTRTISISLGPIDHEGIQLSATANQLGAFAVALGYNTFTSGGSSNGSTVEYIVFDVAIPER